jgi:hypothetical protein
VWPLTEEYKWCLTAALQVLFKQAKLRNAPFEWVYDGLAPALLPQVLARSKGMPLALALVVAAVARRLGVRMRLLCAPEAIQSSTASGGHTDRSPFCAVHQPGVETHQCDNWQHHKANRANFE